MLPTGAEWPTGWDWLGFLMAVVWLLLGARLLVLTASGRRRRRDWVRTEAVVDKVRRKKNKQGGRDTFVHYHWTDAHGRVCTAREERILRKPKRLDTFPVRYDPSDPEKHVTPGEEWAMLFGILVSLASGVMFAGFALYL